MIEQALHDKLADTAGVSALVGSRIYPLLAPQRATRPYVTYQRISTERDFALDGGVGRAQGRIQIDAWAETQLGARAVADAIRAALHGFTGDIAWGGSPAATATIRACRLVDERDFIDDEAQPRLYRISMDFLIAWDEG